MPHDGYHDRFNVTQKMNEQDQKAFKLYGKVPGKNALTKMQKVSMPSKVFWIRQQNELRVLLC